MENRLDCHASVPIQMDHIYTYEEMRQDIDDLANDYPDIIHTSVAATTVLGREIPVIMLGNMDAPHSIMIQSSIHGREYLATQMTMKIIEYYAQNKEVFAPILANTCFYIVPMSNPDGVSIAQMGVNATTYQPLRDFIASTGVNPTLWKANAMGVDLNRNFNADWYHLNARTSTPNYKDYVGAAPFSEIESQTLVSIACMKPYDAFISYHMAGNLIYYDELGNTPENSALSLQLASTIQAFNGYRLSNLKRANSREGVQRGGFNNWAQVQFNRPGVTVELGSILAPAGQPYVGILYEQNKNTWAAAASLYY